MADDQGETPDPAADAMAPLLDAFAPVAKAVAPAGGCGVCGTVGSHGDSCPLGFGQFMMGHPLHNAIVLSNDG